MCIVFFLAMIQAVTITTGASLGREYIASSFYIVVDGVVIGTVTFLQIKPIQISNTLNNQSTVASLRGINKNISKLSMQIMILLCILTTPHIVVYIVREIIAHQLSDYKRSIIEIFFVLVVDNSLCKFPCQCGFMLCFVFNKINFELFPGIHYDQETMINSKEFVVSLLIFFSTFIIPRFAVHSRNVSLF